MTLLACIWCLLGFTSLTHTFPFRSEPLPLDTGQDIGLEENQQITTGLQRDVHSYRVKFQVQIISCVQRARHFLPVTQTRSDVIKYVDITGKTLKITGK